MRGIRKTGSICPISSGLERFKYPSMLQAFEFQAGCQ